MTLRLTADETEALRLRAAAENRSMQEIAREAVRRYIETTSKRDLLDRAIDTTLTQYAEALRRLGDEAFLFTKRVASGELDDVQDIAVEIEAHLLERT